MEGNLSFGRVLINYEEQFFVNIGTIVRSHGLQGLYFSLLAMLESDVYHRINMESCYNLVSVCRS